MEHQLADLIMMQSNKITKLEDLIYIAVFLSIVAAVSSAASVFYCIWSNVALRKLLDLAYHND